MAILIYVRQYGLRKQYYKLQRRETLRYRGQEYTDLEPYPEGLRDWYINRGIRFINDITVNKIDGTSVRLDKADSIPPVCYINDIEGEGDEPTTYEIDDVALTTELRSDMKNVFGRILHIKASLGLVAYENARGDQARTAMNALSRHGLDATDEYLQHFYCARDSDRQSQRLLSYKRPEYVRLLQLEGLLHKSESLFSLYKGFTFDDLVAENEAYDYWFNHGNFDGEGDDPFNQVEIFGGQVLNVFRLGYAVSATPHLNILRHERSQEQMLNINYSIGEVTHSVGNGVQIPLTDIAGTSATSPLRLTFSSRNDIDTSLGAISNTTGAPINFKDSNGVIQIANGERIGINDDTLIRDGAVFFLDLYV